MDKKEAVFGNVKGQVAIFGIMMFIFTFAFALICIPALKDLISVARDSSHLDCNNSSISTGTSATCMIVDLYLPYFIAVILVGGAAWIFARTAFGGGA